MYRDFPDYLCRVKRTERQLSEAHVDGLAIEVSEAMNVLSTYGICLTESVM